MVAECGNKKVAIECDGEKYHGDDMTAADMERQTILERIGWRFIRLRGSEYYSGKEAAMQRIISELHALGIEPEESEAIVETTRETELLKRVKASAADKLKNFEWFEPEIDTIAGALEGTLDEEQNEDDLASLEDKEMVSDEQSPKTDDNQEALLEEQRLKEEAERKALEEELERQRLEQERLEAERAKAAELERIRIAEEERIKAEELEKARIAQEQKAKEEAEKVAGENKEKTFEEKLTDNGFEFIDNRATANLIWIIGSKDDEELIRQCLAGLKFRSMHFEKRGAFRTGNRPAWLVSFSGDQL